ncbi:PAS domain S-box protein, partial [Gemmatimonadota bacterium]
MVRPEPKKTDLTRRVRELEAEVKDMKKLQAEVRTDSREAVYRKLFENSSDAIFLIDKSTGSYLDANPAAELLTGHSLEELKTLFTKDITPVNFKSRLDALVSQEDSIDHGEVIYVRPDGSRRAALLITVPLSGNTVFGIARDISERKKEEQISRNRQELLQAILDNVDSIIVVKDTQGRYLLVNRKTEEIVGRKSEEILGKTARDIYPSGLGESIYQDDMLVIQSKKPVSTEEKLRLDDGKVYLTTKVPLFDDSGRIRGICGLATDITQRTINEEQLKRSEERFRSMFEEAPLGYQSLDAQGCFLAVNKAFVRLLEYEKKELIGNPFTSIVAPESKPMFEKSFPKLKQAGAINGSELELIKKDGTRIVVAIDSRVGHDSKGKFKHTHCVLHDLSERKQLEDERSKAAKLESIGILAGGIAHDFNNILTAILGNLSLAKQIALRDGSSSAELLAAAEKSGLRAKGLTQQLLTFSKGGEPIRKLFCLKELLHSSTLFALRGSNVVCEFDLPEGTCPVEADEGQIHQMINNIVINADQAMPDGGRIRVELATCNISADDKLPLDEGKYLRIKVEDHGQGILEKNLQNIFDPYFTTKRHGSGLGLATCYSIAQKHNGHIHVESRLNHGTSFHIYVPASDKSPLKKEKSITARFSTGRILVMDDEWDVCHVAAKMLEHMGYDVETAANGTEAIALFVAEHNSSHPFSAVILDLTVPGDMGGRETLAGLQAIDSGVKAIVSSGYSNDPVMSDPGKYGFNAVIAKPYAMEELREAVH